MKKPIALLALTGALCLTAATADLLTSYQTGEIKLVADPGFGGKTVWDMLFQPADDRSIAFLSDGSFFRAASKDSRIYKFNAAGEKIFEFGAKGQGPGDLMNPNGLGILDDKTLVVNDSGNKRLSLFDLTGKFVKSVKTNDSTTSLVALCNGKVALVTWPVGQSPANSIFWRNCIVLKDLETGAETELASFEDLQPRSAFVAKIGQFIGAAQIVRLGPDKLVVGYTKSRDIAIYSAEGKKLASFALDLERVKITFDHLLYINDSSSDSEKDKEMGRKIFTMNKAKIELPEYHPYYSDLAVDSDGHILVYLNGLAKMTRDVAFQAYSADGKLLASVKVNPGDYAPAVIRSFYKNFGFTTLATRDGTSSLLARIKIGM
ncbi:MAG: 6-bladed beta-propeller [Candidatus Aminicenantales bacterium]